MPNPRKDIVTGSTFCKAKSIVAAHCGLALYVRVGGRKRCPFCNGIASLIDQTACLAGSDVGFWHAADVTRTSDFIRA